MNPWADLENKEREAAALFADRVVIAVALVIGFLLGLFFLPDMIAWWGGDLPVMVPQR